MTTIAVTGSEGFIASHLVEALVRRGNSVRAMVHYNSFSSAGWLDDDASGRARSRRDPHGRCSRSPIGHGSDRRRRRCLPSRRADRDPVLVPGPQSRIWPPTLAGTLNLLEAARIHEHAEGHPHLDERGLRHGSECPDLRSASAAGAVAVRGIEDRRRQAGRELPPQLRPPGRDAPPVQHLRATPVSAGDHPHDHFPDRRRHA